MSEWIFVKSTDIFDTLIMWLLHMSQVDEIMHIGMCIENSAESTWVIFQLLPG